MILPHNLRLRIWNVERVVRRTIALGLLHWWWWIIAVSDSLWRDCWWWSRGTGVPALMELEYLLLRRRWVELVRSWSLYWVTAAVWLLWRRNHLCRWTILVCAIAVVDSVTWPYSRNRWTEGLMRGVKRLTLRLARWSLESCLDVRIPKIRSNWDEWSLSWVKLESVRMDRKSMMI